MKLTPQEGVMDIEQMLNRIEEIIDNGELPNNLAGDLMSKSLVEFHDKLSKRLAEIQGKLKKDP